MNDYSLLGCKPRNPISTTVSPAAGSNLPSTCTSSHSKELLMDNANTIFTSSVSLPVITSGSANLPVTTHEPGGTGLVAAIGLTTVTPAPSPWVTLPKL